MSEPKVCQNPACRDDQPVLFSWLGSRYCSWDCQWAHKRALADEAVARIDEAVSETPSPSPLPPEPDPAGIHGPIRSPGPLSGALAASALWGASDAVSPIVHPAGVIPPEVEQSVGEQLATQRLAAQIASSVPSVADIETAMDNVREVFSRFGAPAPQEPIELTGEQWESLKAHCPPRPLYGFGDSIGSLLGTPVRIVDPMPKPGWLRRAIKRVFG